MVKAIGHFVGETRKMWSRRPRLLLHRLESLCHQRTAGGGCSTFRLLIPWSNQGLLGYLPLGVRNLNYELLDGHKFNIGY